RKISSFQPLLASHSRKARASALLVLEWLKKMRSTPGRSEGPRADSIDNAAADCHGGPMLRDARTRVRCCGHRAARALLSWRAEQRAAARADVWITPVKPMGSSRYHANSQTSS